MAEITLEFGVGQNRTIGIVQSENDNNSAEIAEAKGEDGKVIHQKAYSVSRERTFEALFTTGTNAPAAGSIVSVGSGETVWTGLVTASNITKSNTEFTKISITAKKSDSATQSAYAVAAT